MSWPVLGKRALALAEPPPKRAKPLKPTRHWLGKLDMVLSRTDLPETVESLIESFVGGARYKKFYEKYGRQNARYRGPGFLPGWHPRVASDTRERWLWNVFAKVPNVERFQTHGFRCNDLVALEPNMRQLKALEGKNVMITYRNGQGRDMHFIKLVMYASDRALHVRDHATDPHSFTLNRERIQRLDLFVDTPIAGAKMQRRVPDCLRDH